MDQLPMETIVHIFQYLSKGEQIKVSEVNKRFREALFSHTLWTEDEKIIEVPACQLKSFRKFLKQTPWLKYLNLLVKGSTIGRPSNVRLTRVFRSLNNLECLTLQLINCRLRTMLFPSALKHISLKERGQFDAEKFITDDILIRIADSCPQLEHIQIKSYFDVLYNHTGLTYLQKKVKGTLQTFILTETYYYPVFNFIDCPPNLTTLCLHGDLKNVANHKHRFALPNLENLQILSLMDMYGSVHFNGRSFFSIFANCSLNNLRFLLLSSCYPCVNEDFYEKFTKLPNLQGLYVYKCSVDIDVLVSFVRESASIKEVAWKAEKGYLKEEIWKLEQLKKEKPVKIYLNLSDATPKDSHYLPRFPNEYFDCIKTFNHSMFVKILENKSPSFFKCHAPIIERSKAFLGK